MNKTTAAAMFYGFAGLLRRNLTHYFRWSPYFLSEAALLFLLPAFVFTHLLGDAREPISGAHYGDFVIGGMIMMVVLQSSFSSAAWPLVDARVDGHFRWLLLAPISPLAFAAAWTAAAVLAALISGALALGVGVWISRGLEVQSWARLFCFAAAGSFTAASLGFAVGLWGRRYDDVAMVETFFVLPLAFLSGAYYAPESLSSPWRELTLANPFTGFVAGFRGGFAADAAAAGAGVFLFAPAAFGFAYWLFRIGYKIRQ